MSVSTAVIRNSYDLKPKSLFLEPSPSYSPQRDQQHQQHQQEYHPPSRRKSPWNTSNTNNNVHSSSNTNNVQNIRHRQKLTVSSLAPGPPFLSIQVENTDCALYVGNIPFSEDNFCKVCFGDSEENSDGSNGKESASDCSGDDKAAVAVTVAGDRSNADNDAGHCVDNCDCELDLKAFVRDRINAAFRIPMREIGIRRCRLFTVVINNECSNSILSTNTAYTTAEEGKDTTKSNINSSSSSYNQNCDEDDKDATKSNANNTDNLSNRSGRRLYQVACIEFDNPKITEHALYLKYTTFSFQRQPDVQTSLKFRRWTAQPPHPSPKQHNPKIITTARSSFVSSTDRDSPVDDTDVDWNSSSGSESSSTRHLCSRLIHVGNIPSDTTRDDLGAFFLGRMNKAFRGVTPPKILRLSMRKRNIPIPSDASNTSNGKPRIDACVEFQDPRVAYRATMLKNRRWHIKPHEYENESDECLNEDEGDDKEVGDCNWNYTNESEKTKWFEMPMLDIETWDSTKYDVGDFFLSKDSSVPGTSNDDDNDIEDGSCALFACAPQTTEEGVPDGGNDIQASKEEKSDELHLANNPIDRKAQSTLQAKNAIAELREYGFLTCTNPSKTPKCDHLFALPGEKEKRSRICHGYVFRGKVCRNRKKKKTRDSLGIACSCPYAHIDSLSDLKDPQDILALLYYVHNNDEVAVADGLGMTPQEYLQREGAVFCKEISPQKENPPQNQVATTPTSTEEKIQKLHSDLSAVRGELTSTQQELHKSENAKQSLLKQQVQGDDTIRSLQDQVAQLKVNLEEAKQNWKASEEVVVERLREYVALEEKYQTNTHISNEIFQLEIVKLKEELKQTRSEISQLQQTRSVIPQLQQTRSVIPQLQQDPYRSPNSHLTRNMPNGRFDDFLETSVPTLMGLTNGKLNQQLQHQQQEALSRSPNFLSFDENEDPQAMQMYSTNHVAVNSEISFLQSTYGNQVVVTNSALLITVTRCLLLPVRNHQQAGAITVSLITTLPKGYPSKGIVGIQVDAHLNNSPRSNDRFKNFVSESLSSLLTVCQWEAEGCAGSLALMRIMKTAELWVRNDWTNLQNNCWLIGNDTN